MNVQFKVGQVVRLKVNQNLQVHIIEVNTQLCYANVQQVWYTGRTHGKDQYNSPFMGKGYERFSAIELEAIPEESKELKHLKKKLEAVKRRKEQCIASQDFEAASKFREEESQIKAAIEAGGVIKPVVQKVEPKKVAPKKLDPKHADKAVLIPVKDPKKAVSKI